MAQQVGLSAAALSSVAWVSALWVASRVEDAATPRPQNAAYPARPGAACVALVPEWPFGGSAEVSARLDQNNVQHVASLRESGSTTFSPDRTRAASLPHGLVLVYAASVNPLLLADASMVVDMSNTLRGPTTVRVVRSKRAFGYSGALYLPRNRGYAVVCGQNQTVATHSIEA